MNIDLKLIENIISSDNLCDKLNSMLDKEVYLKSIREYINKLLDNELTPSDKDKIERYIKKFIINTPTPPEEKFFDSILLKYTSKKDHNKELLETINYNGIRQMLFLKYQGIINNHTKVDMKNFQYILKYYAYNIKANDITSDTINYILASLVNEYESLPLEEYIITYIYKAFALNYSKQNNIFFKCVMEEKRDASEEIDPYYEKEIKGIYLYKEEITNKLDAKILEDIIYQILKLIAIKNFSQQKNMSYTYSDLKFIKETFITSVLGNTNYRRSYKEISFDNELREKSKIYMYRYMQKLNPQKAINMFYEKLRLAKESDYGEETIETKKVASLDELFDKTINQNTSLLKELIKKYPVLASEYLANGSKKTLLNLLEDFYKNERLLSKLKKDLEWYNQKMGMDKNTDKYITAPNREKIINKIELCESFIVLLNDIIMNCDLTVEEIRSNTSILIKYGITNETLKPDILNLIKCVIPKKIYKATLYKNQKELIEIKKKFTDTYVETINYLRTVKIPDDIFMQLYGILPIYVDIFDSLIKDECIIIEEKVA